MGKRFPKRFPNIYVLMPDLFPPKPVFAMYYADWYKSKPQNSINNNHQWISGATTLQLISGFDTAAGFRVETELLDGPTTSTGGSGGIHDFTTTSPLTGSRTRPTSYWSSLCPEAITLLVSIALVSPDTCKDKMNPNGLHQTPAFYNTYITTLQQEEHPFSKSCKTLTPDSSWQHRIGYLVTQVAYATRILESLESGIRPLFVTSLMWGTVVAADIDAYIDRLRRKIKFLRRFSEELIKQDTSLQPPTLEQADLLALTHLETFESDQPRTEAASAVVMHHLRMHVTPRFRFKPNQPYQIVPPLKGMTYAPNYTLEPGKRTVYLDLDKSEIGKPYDPYDLLGQGTNGKKRSYTNACVRGAAEKEAKRLQTLGKGNRTAGKVFRQLDL